MRIVPFAFLILAAAGCSVPVSSTDPTDEHRATVVEVLGNESYRIHYNLQRLGRRMGRGRRPIAHHGTHGRGTGDGVRRADRHLPRGTSRGTAASGEDSAPRVWAAG
jgi:hypothetical protein